ncbi:hypothetical protein [uncultured Pedobacter sp.]|uniref:hypothetical protein n=1 Tax=uncultured Pedobacter sp. TaxID=246139 RepID=UPI0025F39A84|nr:hypothetical protein [uncultured Pedobacter sp.]
MRKAKLLFFAAILAVTITNLKCKKDAFNTASEPTEVLSENAKNYSERLQSIKENFYKLKLDEKFIPKVKQDVTWTPDWDHPTSQVVNDSVSYVFYPLIGFYKKDQLKGEVKTYGAKFYLIVKDENDFYKGVYLNEQKENSKDLKKEVVLENFTGKLLLTNLKTKDAFLLKYIDGKVQDNVTGAQKIASAKLMANKGAVSYWAQQCHTEMRYCVYASDGYSHCGGAIDIIVSYYCQWPSSQCGVSYYMIDYGEETVCEDIWFPDPPQDPTDGGDTGGNGGDETGQFSQSDFDLSTYIDDQSVKVNDIKKYTDCFADGKPANSYTLTIYVDQPVANSNSQWIIVPPTYQTTTPSPQRGIMIKTQTVDLDVGHTFIGFEKNNSDGSNVRQVLGFYPDPDASSTDSKGKIKDNSGHAFDVSYTISVTALQFNQALQAMTSDFNSTNYNLTSYNCTDAALNWINAAGANLASAPRGLFNNTPGDFGQVLRNKSNANKNEGYGMSGKGACN